MDYKKEQREIVEKVRNSCKDRKEWSKYNGDLCCNIIKSYLGKYSLNKNVEIKGPHVFIKEIPNEIDLIIVNKEAKPQAHIECYNIEDVNAVIEVKKSGDFQIIEVVKKGGKELNLKKLFDQITNKKLDILCCCLSISEVIPQKDTSINYVTETKKALDPYKFFVLSNLRNYETPPQIENAWEEFLKELKLI